MSSPSRTKASLVRPNQRRRTSLVNFPPLVATARLRHTEIGGSVRCTRQRFPKSFETGTICPFGSTCTPKHQWRPGYLAVQPGWIGARRRQGIMNSRRSISGSASFVQPPLSRAGLSSALPARPRLASRTPRATHVVDRLAPSLAASVDSTAAAENDSAATAATTVMPGHAVPGDVRTRGDGLR